MWRAETLGHAGWRFRAKGEQDAGVNVETSESVRRLKYRWRRQPMPRCGTARCFPIIDQGIEFDSENQPVPAGMTFPERPFIARPTKNAAKPGGMAAVDAYLMPEGSGGRHMVKAVWNGKLLAESDVTVVVEGNHYFPPESVRQEMLLGSTTTSHCPWKGLANYYSIEVDGKTNKDAAWYYANPSAAAEQIKGHIAFWKDVKVA